MKLTQQMKDWLATADSDGILPPTFPSGRPVSDRTLRRLQGAGYIRRRAYGTKRWSEIIKR